MLILHLKHTTQDIIILTMDITHITITTQVITSP